jgi:hypothetical protein
MPNYNVESVKSDLSQLDKFPTFWELQQKEWLNKLSELSSKREELIKQKLIEKGFGHLIEGIEKRKFPKICQIREGEWTSVYADNNTDEGAFIIAFKETDFNTDYLDKDFSIKMNASIQWKS